VVYQERTRRRLRAGLLLLAVLGLGALGFGLAAPNLAPDVAPVPVRIGSPTALPSVGPFGGTLALYGNSSVNADQGRLNCILQTGKGPAPESALSERAAADLDRRVVDEQALLPLLAIRNSSPDWTITCDGPAATAAQPLFLLATTGQRDLVPMAAFSLATLALVLGIAGVVVFRPLES
jgi:hypothetical protein